VHTALSTEEAGACLTERARARKETHSGKLHCFVQSTSQIRKVIPGGVAKKVWLRVSALRYL